MIFVAYIAVGDNFRTPNITVERPVRPYQKSSFWSEHMIIIEIKFLILIR